MKPKVLFLTKYSRNGASSRMRSFQFEAFFRKEFEVSYCPLFNEDYLNRKYKGGGNFLNVLKSYLCRFAHLFQLPFADVVWIEKEAFPYLPSFFEKLVRFLSKKIIVDYDDAIFHNYDNHRLGIVRKLLGDKIDKVMASADLVIAGNEYIKQRAIKVGVKNIVVVPTVIPASRYPEIKNHPINAVPIIGWIGTPMTQKFLLEVESVLDGLYLKHQFKLHLIGISEDFWKDKPYRIRIIWTEKDEAKELGKIDIGIMPLTNNKFEQGKCGFKLIQYMGCSKPVVASPVGVNTVIVNQGVNGFLCETKEEWFQSLLKLIEGQELRFQLGQNGRKDYVEKFTQEAWGPKLVHLASQMNKEENVSKI